MLLCMTPLLPHPFPTAQTNVHVVNYDRHHHVPCRMGQVSGSQIDSLTEKLEKAPTWSS